MGKSNQSTGRLLRVIFNRQAYLNLLYLGAAFPLGVFYFVFLVSGISLGISTLIIWVGIPILLIVGFGWWWLARFEHAMAVHLLHENMPAMVRPAMENKSTWTNLKAHLTSQVTWKSLLYLFLKFPLGLATFILVITLVALTMAFLSMPLVYSTNSPFNAGISIGMGLPVWHIDSISDALICAFIGLLLWPVTLHITNGLAWVHAKFARMMLTNYPLEKMPATFSV
ncbi:MAG: sensor domain-containing protein [Anaerolineales bacterium]|jgi:hypothetical protein